MLYQVNAPHFCAGLIVEQDKVAGTAPILAWSIEKDWKWLTTYFQSKKWTYLLVEEKPMRISFTGHRPDSAGMGSYKPSPEQTWIRNQVREALIRARNKIPDVEVIGGLALGFDLWAMDEALKLGIPVHAYQPCADQTNRWFEESKREHSRIIAASKTHQKCWERPWPAIADSIPYQFLVYQWRNECMLEDSNILIACWNGKTSGGTYNCLSSARTGKSKVYAPFENLKKDHIYLIDPVKKTAGWEK